MATEPRFDRPWRTALVAVVGLLIAIAVVGVLGIVINRNIHSTVETAIGFDVELEDRGDDLRVAILEVRHYHRDLLLNNPSPARIELWQEQFEILRDEIDALDALLSQGPPDADLPHAEDLRAQAEAYYSAFATEVEQIEDLDAFLAVAEDLLIPLNELAQVAEQVDREGERRAAAAFEAVDQASATGELILLAVLLGLGAMGGALAFAVLRLVEDQRRLVVVEQAAAAQMAAASRAKTDFIADASHELRTPLTVLRGNAEVGLALDAECAHAEILREIVDESARMSRLVDDLLFLARSDADQVPLEPRQVDAATFVAELAARAEVLARERGATLEADLDVRGQLGADPQRVDQALLVLVDNAAKYGPGGGTVELVARVAGDHLVAEVRDRGPGIPPDQMSHVFERFYRADTRRGGSRGGAGLGLAIAAAIVEGHGGTIVAEERPGGGTVMRATLPMSGPSAERAAT